MHCCTESRFREFSSELVSLGSWERLPLKPLAIVLVLSLTASLAALPYLSAGLHASSQTLPSERTGVEQRATKESTSAPVPFATTLGGSDRAIVVKPEGLSWSPYDNAGYRATAISASEWGGARGGLVEIEVELDEIEDPSPFAPSATRSDSVIQTVALKQTAGAHTVYEASARILNWVSRNVTYELDRSQDQDAESVLRRRTAYCTGAARLTVALLEAAGIPAREVPGVVFDGRFAGLHRWVEHQLPQRGWVFSDPLASHFWVPATYLRLDSGDMMATEPPQQLALLERDDQTLPLDIHPHAPHWILARANEVQRRAPALEVSLDGASIAHASLRGGGQEHVARLYRGKAVFVGLKPTSYELLVEPTNGAQGSRLTTSRALELRDSRRHVVRLVRSTSPHTASASGTVPTVPSGAAPESREGFRAAPERQ